MNEANLILEVKKTKAIRSQLSSFSDDDYALAYDKAIKETGFSDDTVTDFQTMWMVERMKRWLLSFLYEAAAENFNVPKASLQQVFTNYKLLLERMDAEYEQAKSDFPAEFGLITSTSESFGTVISTGFTNDSNTGEDITYDVTGGVLVNGK